MLKRSTGSALITNSIRQGTEFFNCSDWQIAPTSRSFAFDLKARRLNYRSVCLCDEEFHVKYLSYINISYSQVLSYFDYYRLYHYIIHFITVTSVFISLSCTDSPLRRLLIELYGHHFGAFCLRDEGTLVLKHPEVGSAKGHSALHW